MSIRIIGFTVLPPRIILATAETTGNTSPTFHPEKLQWSSLRSRPVLRTTFQTGVTKVWPFPVSDARSCWEDSTSKKIHSNNSHGEGRKQKFLPLQEGRRCVWKESDSSSATRFSPLVTISVPTAEPSSWPGSVAVVPSGLDGEPFLASFDRQAFLFCFPLFPLAVAAAFNCSTTMLNCLLSWNRFLLLWT